MTIVSERPAPAPLVGTGANAVGTRRTAASADPRHHSTPPPRGSALRSRWVDRDVHALHDRRLRSRRPPACVAHEPRAAFRRGSSSTIAGSRYRCRTVVADGKQDVDVEGTVPGEDPLAPGTILHIEDLEGDASTQVEVDIDDEAFRIEGLAIDLTANCLELWLEAADGRESARVQLHAQIVGDDEIETVLGCD